MGKFKKAVLFSFLMSQAIAEQTLDGKLENAYGTLAETVPQLVLSSIQHADQITTERRTNHGLRSFVFYTADGAMYRVEDKPVLYLTRGPSNPIFRNLEAATDQLLRTHNYIPPQQHVEEAISAPDTLRIDILSLKLAIHDDEFSYFTINTEKPNDLNEAQQAMAWRVYGQGNEYSLNMAMLENELEISETRIYVLNPEYVQSTAGTIARGCGLFEFDDDSRFIAIDRYLDDRDALRGVRVDADKGGSQQNEHAAHIEPVLAKPIRTAAEEPSLLQRVTGSYNLLR